MSKDNRFSPKNHVDLPGITDPILRRFKEAYLPAYRDPHYERRPEWGGGWKAVDRGGYITEAHLRNHLARRFTLGYPGHCFTKWVCADVDRHHGESDFQVYGKADQIIGCFPNAQAFPVQSSNSGGVHLYYFLPKPAWSPRAAGYFHDQLVQNGIADVEVYPMGESNFRVPFGEGSSLLDPDDWVPVRDNVGSLLAFLWLIEHGKLETLQIPATYQATATPRGRGRDHSPSDFMREVDLLLTVGLPGPSTRNDATLMLNWYLQVIGRRSKTSTHDFLNRWIAERHNGYSADFRRNPETVYAHNLRIVENFDPDQVKWQARAPDISPQDQQRIQVYLSQLHLKSPQRRLYEHILVHCVRWCDVSGEECVAEIPSTYLHQCDYRYKARLRVLMAKDLIRQIAGYSVREHQCRKYAVRIPKNLSGSSAMSYNCNN